MGRKRSPSRGSEGNVSQLPPAPLTTRDAPAFRVAMCVLTVHFVRSVRTYGVMVINLMSVSAILVSPPSHKSFLQDDKDMEADLKTNEFTNIDGANELKNMGLMTAVAIFLHNLPEVCES